MKKFFAFCKKHQFPRRKFSSKPYSNILIISNTGVGDTMWGTPALKLLKKKYPHSLITVLASKLSYQVLKNNPHIDRFIIIKTGGGLNYFTKFYFLFKQKFETIILFHCSYKWATAFAYFLGPKRLIGFYHDAKHFDFLLTELLEAKLNHPIIQRLMLIKRIGVVEEDYEMNVYLSSEELKKADAFLEQFDIDPSRPLIGLQPGAKDAFKCWPISHFADLAARLHLQGAQIVVFGSHGEINLAKQIAEKSPIIMACGQLSLRVSAALLSRMNIFVTNDTGPLHLALSFSLPIVTFFGPTPSHLCWPHINNPKVRILSRVSPCQKCVYRRCLKPYCMELISVDEALVNVQLHLKQYFHNKEQSSFLVGQI